DRTTRAVGDAPRTPAVSRTPRCSMSETTLVEGARDPRNAVLNEIIPAGEPWVGTVCRGEVFRIVDLEGNQAVDTLFFNAANTAERYSACDTVRSQGNIYLTTGTQLVSNEGNVMLTIVADT